MKLIHGSIALVLVALLMAGCSDHSKVSSDISLSGVVEKGFFTTGTVTVRIVDSNMQTTETRQTNLDNSRYELMVPKDSTAFVEVSGTFFNEVTGELSTLESPLRTVLATGSEDLSANVNLLTTLVASRVEVLASSSTIDSPLIDSVVTQLLEALGMDASTPPPSQWSMQSINGDSDSSWNFTLMAYSISALARAQDQGINFEQVVLADRDTIFEQGDVSSLLSGVEGQSLQSMIEALVNEGGFDGLADIDLSAMPQLIAECDDQSNSPCRFVEYSLESGQEAVLNLVTDSLSESDSSRPLVFVLSHELTEVFTFTAVIDQDNSVATVDGDVFGVTERQSLPAARSNSVELTFLPGEQRKAVDINLVLDANDDEGVEDLLVTVEQPSSATLVATSDMTLKISDARVVPTELPESSTIELELACVSTIKSGDQWILDTQRECLRGSSPQMIQPSDWMMTYAKVRLVDSCSGQNCISTDDWLVEFYLVAGQDVVEEVYLGRMQVPSEKIIGLGQLETNEAEAAYVDSFIDVSGDTLQAYLAASRDVDEFTRFEARLLNASNATTNVASQEFNTPAVPAVASFGDLSLEVQQPSYSGGINCQLASSLPLVMTVQGSAETSQEITVCAQFNDQTLSYDQFEAFSISLNDLIVDLPDGYGSRALVRHPQRPYTSPYMASNLPGIQLSAGHLDEWTTALGVERADYDVQYLLSHESWAFEYAVSDVFLTELGIAVAVEQVHNDPELAFLQINESALVDGVMLQGANEWYSDNRFIVSTAELKDSNVHIFIESQTTVEMVAGRTTQRMQYPQLDLMWEELYTVSVSGSDVRAMTDTVPLRLSLEVSTQCGQGQCGSSSIPTRYAFSGEGAKSSPQGDLLADVISLLDHPVYIGSKATASGTVPAFTRNDLVRESHAVLALGGYRFVNQLPSSQYRSHIERSSLSRFGESSDAYVSGDHAPIGVSYGPEVLSEPTIVAGGGRMLTDQAIIIASSSGRFQLSTAEATKFVLRNSGVTGVQNVRSSALSQPILWDGFPIKFDTVGFQFVGNSVTDDRSISGNFAVAGQLGGSAGTDFVFQDVELFCDGSLGMIQLVTEACDEADNNANGFTDENCHFALDHWQMPGELFSLGFEQDLACFVSSPSLVISHTLDAKAIDEHIIATTRWSPEGNLNREDLASVVATPFDSSSDHEGFEFTSTELSLVSAQQGHGYVRATDSRVSLPFWQPLNVDMIFKNSVEASAYQAQPTFFFPEATATWDHDLIETDLSMGSANQDMIEYHSNVMPLYAEYSWGNGLMDFALPISYEPWQESNTNRSQFFGETETRELFIVDVSHGIEYISPIRTQINFGMSADIQALKEMNFQIDPDNEAVLREVDELLMEYRVIDQPILQNSLGIVQTSMAKINSYANTGMETASYSALEAAIDGSVQGIKDASGEDPFELASSALGEVNALPAMLVSQIEREYRRPLIASINQLQRRIDDELTRVSDKLQSSNDGTIEAREFEGILSDLNTIISTIDESGRQVKRAVDDVSAVVADVQSSIVHAQTAIIDIEKIILEEQAQLDKLCSMSLDGYRPSGLLSNVSLQIDDVKTVVNQLNVSELSALIELFSQVPGAEESFSSTMTDVGQIGRDVQGSIEILEESVQQFACDATQSNEADRLVAGALELLSDITVSLDQADQQLSNFDNVIDQVQAYESELQALISEANETLVLLQDITEPPQFDSVSISEEDINSALSLVDENLVLLESQTKGNASLISLSEYLTQPLKEGVNDSAKHISNALVAEFPTVNVLAPDELKRRLIVAIMASDVYSEFKTFYEQEIHSIIEPVQQMVERVTEPVNDSIAELLEIVNGEVREALAAAEKSIKNLPIDAAELDGYAVIRGNNLDRMHIRAMVEVAGGSDSDSPTQFKGAFDISRWGVEGGSGSCGVSDALSRVDVMLTAYDVPLSFGGNDIKLSEANMGFTLNETVPVGVFGYLGVDGSIQMSPAIQVFDPQLMVGLGDVQNYFGASATAQIADVMGEAAMFFGRSCNNNLLVRLDEKVGDFITLPSDGSFAGLYARGSATVPIIPGGCALNLSAMADAGFWAFNGDTTTIGGILGGAAIGRVGCLGAIRGQVDLIFEYLNGQALYSGSAFGAAGVGSCEPNTWKSVARSRRDSWCATVDAQIEAEYRNDRFIVTNGPSISGPH